MVDTRDQTGGKLPHVFGRYLLLRRLSQGGMGEIFLAKAGEIQGFEKLVVIKKILPQLAADRDFIKRFIDEAQIAIKLNHGNIATVHEVGMVEGEYFLAIEYVEGRDLRRTLSKCHEVRERIPPDICLYVAREVADALAYAHRRIDEHGRPINLVHCDISPPNVLLSFEGEVKIIDFGIARSQLRRIGGTNPNIGFGKFGYMAPEQLVSGGEIDRRTDIYALGVVLYEMLIGERLFQFTEGMDYREVARAVTAGDIPLPSERQPELGATFDDLVGRALRPDPDKRFPSAEDMRDAIQRLLYAMNPGVSADALARFLYRTFAADVTAERRRVEHDRGVDLAQFQSAFENQRTHTVSFAIASATENPGSRTQPLGRDRAVELADEAAQLAGPGPVMPPLAVPGEPAAARALPPPGAITFSPVRRIPRLPRGRLVTYVIGIIGLATLGGMAAMLLMRSTARAPATEATVDAAVDAAVAPVAFAAAVDAGRPPPVPPPVVEKAAPRESAPARAIKAPRHGREPRPVKPAPRSVSAEQVEAKFRAVRREYGDFKNAYGSRLEPEWNAVLFLATYGKADKYERLDGLIDRLRVEMGRVRRGD